MRRPNAAPLPRGRRGAGAAAPGRRGFPAARPNALALDGWRPLFAARRPRRRGRAGARRAHAGAISTHLERDWPAGLPAGVIHADLFPDNVFFLGETAVRADRLLLRLQRSLRLRRRHLPQRLVLRDGPLLQPHQGRRRCSPATSRCGRSTPPRGRGAAAAGARRGAALHADPALRLAERPAGRAGASRRTRSNMSASCASTATSTQRRANTGSSA